MIGKQSVWGNSFNFIIVHPGYNNTSHTIYSRKQNLFFNYDQFNSHQICFDVYWTVSLTNLMDQRPTACDVRYAHTVRRPELTTWHAWIDLSWPSLTCRDLALFQRSDFIPSLYGISIKILKLRFLLSIVQVITANFCQDQVWTSALTNQISQTRRSLTHWFDLISAF